MDENGNLHNRSMNSEGTRHLVICGNDAKSSSKREDERMEKSNCDSLMLIWLADVWKMWQKEPSVEKRERMAKTRVGSEWKQSLGRKSRQSFNKRQSFKYNSPEMINGFAIAAPYWFPKLMFSFCLPLASVSMPFSSDSSSTLLFALKFKNEFD